LIETIFGKYQFARLSTLFENVSKSGTQASRVLRITAASAEELVTEQAKAASGGADFEKKCRLVGKRTGL
jgi:hypothetical protein